MGGLDSSSKRFNLRITAQKMKFSRKGFFNFFVPWMVQGMVLKFYSSVAKGLKLKVIKLWGLVPTFREITGKNLVGEAFLPPFPPILNRVKEKNPKIFQNC